MSGMDIASELEFAYSDLADKAAEHDMRCDELFGAIRKLEVQKKTSSEEVQKYLRDVERFKRAAADSLANSSGSSDYGGSSHTLQTSAEEALQLAVLRENELMVKLTELRKQLSVAEGKGDKVRRYITLLQELERGQVATPIENDEKLFERVAEFEGHWDTLREHSVDALAQSTARQGDGKNINGVNAIIDESMGSTRAVLAELEQSEMYTDSHRSTGTGSNVSQGRPPWRGDVVINLLKSLTQGYAELQIRTNEYLGALMVQAMDRLKISDERLQGAP
eukprot:g3024.t1